MLNLGIRPYNNISYEAYNQRIQESASKGPAQLR